MIDNLNIALQITLVGMGLVFGAIILVTLMMGLLVRLTTPRADRHARKDLAAAEGPQVSAPTAAPDNHERLRRAAAVAVAVALSKTNGFEPNAPTLPVPEPITPWQSVMRGRQLKNKGRQ